MAVPEGTPATTGNEEIRQAIFELLSEIIDQDPPKVPSDYFSQEFCIFIDLCLQVRSQRVTLFLLQLRFSVLPTNVPA